MHLADLLRTQGGVFAEEQAPPRPRHFGDPSREYRALSSGAGVVDVSDRTRLELSGHDRATFLHNLSTNDVRKLAPGTGCEAFLCDARGHTLAHVFVICRPDSLIVETVGGQEQRLLSHLDRYLIRERVEIAGRGSAWGELFLSGPESTSCLASLISDGLPAERLQSTETSLAGQSVTIVKVELTRTAAYLVLCLADSAAEVWQSLRTAGAVPCGTESLEVARIEAGFPWFGVDITDKNLPQEVGRDSWAISFTKGCYLGQETVARIDALGHVNRLLVPVQFASQQVPPSGCELSVGGQVVGQATSTVFSPHLAAPLALAYVRRGSNQPGTMLDSSFGEAKVITLPL